MEKYTRLCAELPPEAGAHARCHTYPLTQAELPRATPCKARAHIVGLYDVAVTGKSDTALNDMRRAAHRVVVRITHGRSCTADLAVASLYTGASDLAHKATVDPAVHVAFALWCDCIHKRSHWARIWTRPTWS